MATVPIKKFSFRILVFSVIMAAISVICQLLLPPQYSSPALPYIVLFFTVLSLFTTYIVMRSDARKEGRKFVSSYLLSRIIKFFSCAIFVSLYLLLNENDRFPFAIGFIVIYFAYAGLEVYVIKKGE